MPPEAFGAASPEACMDAGPAADIISLGDRSSSSSRAATDGTGRQGQQDGQGQEVLVDDKGRPYNLGPKGFVRDLNTRAVKIARRVMEQSGDTSFSAADRPAAARKNNLAIEKDGTASTPAAAAAAAAAPDAGTSGTVRSSVAQEIRFVLGGRLPFVKRSEWLVRTWVCISAYFLLRYGFAGLGFAPTLGAFTIMYFVLDFYSGVLHVVLDDEWNMNVPLLSQPAMEFQYHHHIPDDGCSRPFVEGMGDLNFIIGLHLALFTALFYRGGCEDKMLLTTGAWKMLLAYWGIWNHRQVSYAVVVCGGGKRQWWWWWCVVVVALVVVVVLVALMI